MINIKRRGMMVVISSPSGAGKTTLCKMLLNQDNNIKMSVSATTREKRVSEIEGVDYYFIDKQKFEHMVEHEEFLEYARVFDFYYGTPKKQVEELLQTGVDLLFDIDWQGAKQLTEKVENDLVKIFILPPSMAELSKRLRARNQDNEEVIEKRLNTARDEIKHIGQYDYVLVNYDLDQTFVNLHNIVAAERLKRKRLVDLDNFIIEL